MRSWLAKSSEVAIRMVNVEEGLRERFLLNKFLFVYIQDLANNIQRIRLEEVIFFFYLSNRASIVLYIWLPVVNIILYPYCQRK